MNDAGGQAAVLESASPSFPSVRDIGVASAAIRVRNVSKLYKIYPRNSALLREVLFGQPLHSPHWALKDVSFEVPRGHVVGIIGPNGSGKSTLLKIVAGLLDAIEGVVEVTGKISSILELGTGFHPDYTGRENIITGGMCLGMSRAEIEAKASWIVDFTELGSVIDQPFRTYSSGMQARLTFATAVSIDPDILIIDEALAAGDSYFVAKSFKRIRQICASGATVLFVSHGTNQVAQLCNSAIWLDNGVVREAGPAREVAKHYDYDQHVRISNNVGRIVEIEIDPDDVTAVLPAAKISEPIGLVADPHVAAGQAGGAADDSVQQNATAECGDAAFSQGTEATSTSLDAPSGAAQRSPETPYHRPPPSPVESESLSVEPAKPVAKVYRRGPIVIDRVVFLDGNGRTAPVIRTWDTLRIDVHYHCEGEIPLETLGLGIGIERERDMVLIAQFNTVNQSGAELDSYENAPFRVRAGNRGVISAMLPDLQILEGQYLVSLGVCPNIPGVSEFYEYHHRVYKLAVIPAGYPSGAVFYPKVVWQHCLDGGV